MKSIIWLILLFIGLYQVTFGQKLELVVQTTHSDSISAAVFSPDGRIMATGSFDATIKLWDVFSSKQLRTFAGHTSTIKLIAFSGDGKTLVSGDYGKTIKIWNVETGKELRTFKDSQEIHSIVISPDGKKLATRYYNSPIKLWNLETEKEPLILEKGYNFAFSADNKFLLTMQSNYEVKLWDAASGEQLWSIKNLPQKNSSEIDFGSDQKTVISSGYFREKGNIILKDKVTGRILKRFIGHTNEVNSIALSSDENTLASGSDDMTVKLWNVKNGNEVKTLKGHLTEIKIVLFSPDGKTLASQSSDGVIKLWNLADGRELQTLSGSPIKYSSTKIQFSPDGKQILSEGTFSNIKIWNTENGHQLVAVQHFYETLGGEITARFDESGGIINLFNPFTFEKLGTIKSDETKFYHGKKLAISPSGDVLAIVSSKGFKLWNVKTLEELWNLNTGESTFDAKNKAGFSIDCKLHARVQNDGTVKVWDVANKIEVITLRGNKFSIDDLEFDSDGKTLTTKSHSKELVVWDITTWQKKSIINLEKLFSIPGIPYNIIPKDKNSEKKESEPVTQPCVVYDLGKFSIKNITNNTEAAFYYSLDETDWVVITPDGRFDASEGALKLMHYTYGLEIINFEQLREMYYEPGLLQKLLGYSKEPLRPIVPLKDVKLYPEIIERKFDANTGKLNIKLKSRGGIGKTEVFVNGKRVVEDARDERLKQNPNVPPDTVVSLTVDISPSAFVKGVENQIKIITSNYLKEIGKGNIQSRGVELVHLDKGNAELELPTLYAIVGGVSDYTGDALDLRFAAKDAEDFSNALRLGANRLFCPSNKAECLGKINITTLSTARQNAEEQPTKENFKKAFADIAAKAKPEDIFLVYLSGHGVTLGAGTDTYFYLTKDARAAGKTDLEKNFQTVAISSTELTDWLTPNKDNLDDIFVKALKQVIILDTCAAGNFAREDWKKDRDLSGDQIRAMEFLKDKTGTFILMGSASNAVSYEANRYNQGLLTYALLEGIKGFALQKATNNVDVRLLFDYAEKRVPDLAKDMNLDQRPIIKQPSGNTFLIGQMTDAEKTKINLPQPKPLLLRPLLTNPETGDDDLKLIPELRKRFDAESSYEVMQRSGKGEPALIYIDDDSFPSAVRVTGTYTVEGETVRLKAFLRKDGKTIATLPEIVGKKEELST